MILDDLLLEAEPLQLDTVIDNFGCFKHVPASLKHANGKYIICNGASAQRDGIPIEDYVGLTAYDLGRLAQRKQGVTQNAVAVDQRLCAKKAPYATYKQAILAHDHSIVIEEILKRPVLGSKQQVAAILGCAQDITHHAHPMLLFQLYESFMPTPEAIQKFLHYKKLDTVFEALPTREELFTLITMRDFQETTQIAKALTCHVSDVERHQAQLCDKLPVIGLDEVLAFLEWHSPAIAKDAIGGIEELF